MPVYTPPADDAVDFELEAYSPVADDAVEFDLSEEDGGGSVLLVRMQQEGLFVGSGGLL